MWLWIDLTIVLVAVAAGVLVAVGVWGTFRRFLRELGSVHGQVQAQTSDIARK